MSVRASLAAVAVVVGTVFVVGCAQTSSSPISPSSSVSSVTPSSVSLSQASAVAQLGAVSSGLTASALGTGANAGWTCIPIGAGIICAPPGLGLPSVPPVADYGGAPTYNLSAFTADHQFIHRFKLLRPDLYHGEPCLGGAPWNYIGFLDYYECIIKD
jgi:hypothetical protein